MNPKVYFDYAATTPVDPRVMNAMHPFFTEIFGNPSSIHHFGQKAETALDASRQLVSELLHCHEDEIIFTSCGTESDNLALRGVAHEQRRIKNARHLLISPVEHHAVLETALQLQEQSEFEVELLPVDTCGMVNPVDVAAKIRSDTALVSVVYANNEIGTINPIEEIGVVCLERGVPFHSDAVQAAAHLPMNVVKDRLDLLSIGAHKFYGPKGVGVLYARRSTPISPVQTGGKQENGLRAGTQNVPYIVGLAEAFRLAQVELEARQNRLTPLRDYLIGQVLEEIPNSRLTGHPTKRLPNHASFVFENVDGNMLLRLLDVAGFACSSGSACKVGSPKPSEILTAIGLSDLWALGSLRVTLGSGSTPEQIEAFIQVLPDLVKKATR